MNERTRRPLPRIEVIAATQDQEPILTNLLELYARDFSEFHEVEFDTEGRFAYKHLPLYWSEEGRCPFLVWVDGIPAGFALVKRGSEISGDAAIWDVAEFFVSRAYRRSGIGITAAHEVWRRFPGLWEVRVMESNLVACQFWARATEQFACRAIHAAQVERDGAGWRVFSFESVD